MVSVYAHNDLLLGIIDAVTGTGADLGAAQQAFGSCRGDFADRFAAAVQAAVASQFRAEVFIEVPQQRDGLTKPQLENLVRPASAWLKSQPSKAELLDELDRIDRRQQRRAEWIPKTTADGKPWGQEPDTDGAEAPERDVTVGAFGELGLVTVRLPAVWDERPELAVADAGIGQLELVLYSLLGIGAGGDWNGGLDLDAEANEALVPDEARWWAVPGYEPKPLPPAEDAGVASELLATVQTLGGVPVRETDGSIEVIARALAGAKIWRHSPQWTMQSSDIGSGAQLFTTAQASLAAWADETGTGLVVHVDGAVLHEHEGILASPGPLHGYLLCISREGDGSDAIAMVHRLVLSCPGDNWCRRGGCATADAATFEVLAPLLVPVSAAAQVAAAAGSHTSLFDDLYGPGSQETTGEPVLDVCAAALDEAGWKELSRMDIEGGMQELLARQGDRFLTLAHDPATRQLMLRDGKTDMGLLMDMLGEDGLIVGPDGHETIDSSDKTVEVWGLDALTAASDVLRGRISLEGEPAFEPLQATLLGLHPFAWGMASAPGVEPLFEAQLRLLLHTAAAQPGTA